ncbi:unnamed protein product [Timema podura]|uniref:Uncharacterized protein n=1 Tax=Timema podura TaxID=61482 RepID=A0ABN7NM56_TIMPD|nr:unnamed protein product [Timema podura]
MSGRASARSTSVCDRRPMSAMPMLENQTTLASPQVTSCQAIQEAVLVVRWQPDSQHVPHNFLVQLDCCRQVDQEFGEEFVETLPSVLFLEDLSSESFGHTWIKSELETFRSDDTHTVMSEQCQSEMSLGQKIKAMAQHSKDMRPTNPTTPPEKHPEIIGSTLMPGLALKPPIPHPKPNLSSRGNVSVCNKNNTSSLQDNKEDTHSPSCSHIFQNKYERSYMFQNSDPTVDKIINNVIVEGSEAVGSSYHSPNSNDGDVITDIQELVLQRENEFFILKESNDATNLAIREHPSSYDTPSLSNLGQSLGRSSYDTPPNPSILGQSLIRSSYDTPPSLSILGQSLGRSSYDTPPSFSILGQSLGRSSYDTPPSPFPPNPSILGQSLIRSSYDTPPSCSILG